MESFAQPEKGNGASIQARAAVGNRKPRPGRERCPSQRLPVPSLPILSLESHVKDGSTMEGPPELLLQAAPFL